MTKLQEAISISSADKTGKVWRARILESNKRGSSAYYPAEVLERDGAKAFPKGTHMFLNHMSEMEMWDRPEGNVENLVGVLESAAEFESDGLYADLRIFADKREWVLERADHIGLSIRANGIVEEIDGVPMLKELTEGLSVDIVTRAGAGGKFTTVLESAKPSSESNPVSESKKEDIDMEFPKELAEALDAQAQKVDALLEAVTKLVSVQEAKVEEPVVEEAAGPSAAEIAGKLVEAKLTPKAQARVLAAVEGGAALEESIQAEKEIAAEVIEEAKKAGASFAGAVDDEDSSSLTEVASKAGQSIFIS